MGAEAIEQDFAPTVAFFRSTDDAFLFHQIDQARGPRITDTTAGRCNKEMARFTLDLSNYVDRALEQINLRRCACLIQSARSASNSGG